jgi:hypothetical protein
MNAVDPRIDPRLVPEKSLARVINGPRNEYIDLPIVVTLTAVPQVITRWALSDEERKRILLGEDIYVTLQGVPINPFFVTVGPVNWKEQR